MRVTKKVQYGLLLTMYISRAGRATLETASENLGISRSFLEQIARKLRKAGVLRSLRGPNGGYVIAGNPRALDVACPLGYVESLSNKEHKRCLTGSLEYRCLATLAENLDSGIWATLNTPISVMVSKQAISEGAYLDRLNDASPVN